MDSTAAIGSEIGPGVSPIPPMNPSIPRRRAKDTALRREAERYGKIERCWHLLIKALGLDPCAPSGQALLVTAVALRATHHHRYRLPSGAPDPYLVFGLNPAVPTARDPAIIQSYYHQAFDLLNRSLCSHPLDPYYPAFSHAARLVADAWAVLSDAHRKASLDSRFEKPPPPPPPQPSAPPTAQPGRGTSAATTIPSDVAHGRRAG
uniref:J domain-containing protein n=1 Tax=Oryza glumipatula TaxID=40148 RepID=A0A0E0BNQ1_9ORYZ